VCPVYTYHQAFAAETSQEIAQSCRQATIGCAACKAHLAKQINAWLEPMRERRAVYEMHPGRVEEILRAGTEKARHVAQETMREVRDAMGINYRWER